MALKAMYSYKKLALTLLLAFIVLENAEGYYQGGMIMVTLDLFKVY